MSEPSDRTRRAVGLQAAYGRRRRLRIFARRLKRYFAVRVIAVARRLIPTPDANHLRVEPPSLSSQEWSDLAARLAWYLPHLAQNVVLEDGPRADPAAAPHMAPELVREPRHRTTRAAGREHALVHRLQFRTLLRRGRRLGATTIVDPHAWRGEDTRGFQELARLFDAGADELQGSVGKLLSHRVVGGSALIVGTGPSADDLDPSAITADVRITCNSAVRNLEFIEAFSPTVVAFGDPIHHLGPSRYAASFREDLLRALECTEALVAVPPFAAFLLTQHYPELAPRIVGIPTDARTWRWPSHDDPGVRATDNILSMLMLPIAFALADDVHIAGCDGRAPGERLFWRHGRSIQYDDEVMETLFMAHPGWYQDRDYADYFEEHCRVLEDLIQAGESSGKTVRSVTSSFIPALAQRQSEPLSDVTLGAPRAS